jgi:hypothetical protein
MARVPVITSPCPLRWKSMPSAGMDFCGQCRRRVHNLDGMSDASRAAFFASCSGEVCVAYTVSRPAALIGALGLGMASMMHNAAAQDTVPSAMRGDDAGAAQNSVPTVVNGPTCDPNGKGQSLELIMVGGTTKAHEAAWVDERELALPNAPQIAEIDASEWLPTPTSK